MIFLSDFSVIKPEPGLIIWTTVIFLTFWFLISKFAFAQPIASALKQRETDIQNALDEAKKARQEMANLKAENEELLALARDERAKILKEAKEVKESIIAEAREKAKDETKKIVASAKEQIENQKMAAMIDLKNQVGSMALEIAEKVLRQKLQGNTAQEEFVSGLVKEIKLN